MIETLASEQKHSRPVSLMVATLAKAASADYYIQSQASYRPVDEYYASGEEPDGLWWNPSGVTGRQGSPIADGAVIDSADFYKLYNGFHPKTGEKLTQNAGSPTRCPAYDLTFNADKTVSALWAVAPPELRSEIEDAHNDAVRVALADTIEKHCSYTRIRDRDRNIRIVPADLTAALFQHGASRSGDPHLHTHCVILNVARAHHDGGYRAVHGGPLYCWQKAAGAVYRAEIAWLLRERLGIEMEVHGKKNAYTRIAGIPEGLVKDWSKRNIHITDTAARMGVVLDGNGALREAVQRFTRDPKQQGVDPEERHLGWIEKAGEFVASIGSLIQSIAGKAREISPEQVREVTQNLDALPETMTHHDAVFRYTDIVEQTANACMGLLSREARNTAISRVLRSPALIRLDKPEPSPDAAIDLAHTRAYTSADNLQAEKDIHALATELASVERFAIAPAAVQARIDLLAEDGYPLSDEQIDAIRFAASAGGIAIIEGAAGSGKTTTLRPLADLYREGGCKVIATGVPWVVSEALGNDLGAPNYSVAKLISMVEHGHIAIDEDTVIAVDEAGMLSSQQARRILRLGSEHGAKLIFAGDTEQQQPVTAGPGLRLIRDVAGSIRVDRMRRQQPDAEDVLVALHGDRREDARLNASLMSAGEQDRLIAGYMAIPEDRRPQVQPWQAAASDAFRRADAGVGIEAYAARGRFHLGRDLEATLNRLVDDWDDYRRANPDRSSVVIAQSNAEVSTLSFLMRERSIRTGGSKPVTIQACRGREPDAKPTALEIAVGDRIRIGALHWRKQLFNGTVVTVDELRHTISRVDGSVRAWIRGHTDRGREVSFWHDEIRSFHGQVRLDYGYAMTMASSQGMTVDRAFVLANQKPARETVYPAATRHRERLDFYVDRKPLEFEIREQRPEDQAGDPVTDKDVREHLAQRWSRLQPKEAARDYMSQEMLADIHSRTAATLSPDRRSGPSWLGANDNGSGTLAAAASRMRYSEIAIAQGATAERLGDAYRDLAPALETWKSIHASDGNAAFALDPAFEADFRRSLQAIDSAKPFMEGGARQEELLLERGGITGGQLAEFAERHQAISAIRARARSNGHDSDEQTEKPGPTRPLPSDPDELAGEIIDELDRLVPLEDAGAGDPVFEQPGSSDEPDLVPPEFEIEPALLRAHEQDLAQGHDPAGVELPTDRIDAAEHPIDKSLAPVAPRPEAEKKPSTPNTLSPALSAKDVEARHSQFLADALQNQRAARSEGIHPYQTAYAPRLIDRARELLRLEALPAANARALRDAVAAYDDWLRSRRRAPERATAAARPRRGGRKSRAQAEFDALYDKFLTEAAANRAAARSQGIHPYMTKGAPGIIREARELIRLGRLPGEAAETLADTIVQYERMRTREAQRQTTQETRVAQLRRQEGRKGKDTNRPTPAADPRFVPTPSPQTVSPTESPAPPPAKAKTRAEPVKPPTNERSATKAKASPPPSDALEEYRAWIERKRVEMEDLFGGRPEPAKPHPDIAYAAQVDPAPRPLSVDEVFDELQRRCDANVETARATDVEPYETEDWSSIHEAAKHLVGRDDVSDDVRPFIRELIAGYYRWVSRQRSRHDLPAQSHRIRY